MTTRPRPTLSACPPRLGSWATVLATAISVGCTGAPSQNLLGSYFPSWLLCALAAVAATAVIRIVFARTSIHAQLPLPLLVYLSLATAFTFAFWLLCFG